MPRTDVERTTLITVLKAETIGMSVKRRFAHDVEVKKTPRRRPRRRRNHRAVTCVLATGPSTRSHQSSQHRIEDSVRVFATDLSTYSHQNALHTGLKTRFVFSLA